MSGCPTVADEFWPLLDAVCDGEIADQERSSLEAHLDKNLDAQRVYVDHIGLCMQVNAWSRGQRAGKAGLARVAGTLRTSATAGLETPTAGAAFRGAVPGVACLGAPADAPAIASGSPWTLHVSFNGAVLAYLLAALVLGAGILAASATFRGSRDADVLTGARPSPQIAPSAAALELVVGYVTNVPNCRWTGPDAAVRLGSPVPLGRTFALESGSLEITYITGERITLHGPAVFESRWFNGGLLAQGKLTAQATVTKAMDVAQREQIKERQRQIYLKMAADRHSPGSRNVAADPFTNFYRPAFLFFIRTPSALAISRGAEFSVSVDATGATNTRLAAGLIEAWYPGGGRPNDVISSSAHWAWSSVAFTPKHDVQVLYGTGKPPELMRTALANAPHGVWPAGPSGGGSLRIRELEAQQPRATAGTLPSGRHDKATN